MTATAGRPLPGLAALSLVLAVLAPVVVALTFGGSGKFAAAGAYMSLIAIATSWWNRRSGDRSRSASVALVVSTISLIVALSLLALAIGLSGWGTLWFDPRP